ncbi:MAG: ornithine carbamoyltransferase [bacterium]|nr:ornithine carbamoyltransferase [bacterium]
MRTKDLVAIRDLHIDEVFEIFEESRRIKDYTKRGMPFKPLEGKTLGMMFSKSSTRTRVSFEVGMYQLGGYPMYLDIKKSMQMGRGETVHDTGKVLSRYLDGIMIRTFAHDDVVQLAKYSSIPVINGLTDLFHPCQILADIFTLTEKYRIIGGLTVAFVGDGNNVANSWLFGAAKTGINLNIVTPKGYECDTKLVEEAREIGKATGCTIKTFNDPIEGVKGVDVIYTDVWASMGQEDEAAKRIKEFEGYQINSKLVSHANKDYKVMHCLPAHRGEEITDEVIDDEAHSIVFDEAENRLHVQKGILYLLMGEFKA